MYKCQSREWGCWSSQCPWVLPLLQTTAHGGLDLVVGSLEISPLVAARGCIGASFCRRSLMLALAIRGRKEDDFWAMTPAPFWQHSDF